MFIEKKRKGVSPRLFTANGTTNGVVTLSDTSDLFVKQIIYLASNTQQPRELEIKRFVNENSFKVGPRGSSITAYVDVSDFLVADGAVLSAPEQDRPGITEKEHERAVYAEEPIVAKRVVGVDEFGRYYSSLNPVPVAGSLSIDTSELVEPIIVNFSILNANTDYLISLPSNVRRFFLKIRDGKGPLRIYQSAGGPFYTLERGAMLDSKAIKTSGLSLRVQSSQANSVVEIFYWNKV